MEGIIEGPIARPALAPFECFAGTNKTKASAQLVLSECTLAVLRLYRSPERDTRQYTIEPFQTSQSQPRTLSIYPIQPHPNHQIHN
jgi:hypothetical protein